MQKERLRYLHLSGVLHNQENTLEFTNNFGKQQITADQVREANAAGGEQILQGALTIAAEEVSGAKAGNYTGTTTFTISYKQSDDSQDRMMATSSRIFRI